MEKIAVSAYWMVVEEKKKEAEEKEEEEEKEETEMEQENGKYHLKENMELVKLSQQGK